MQSTNSPTFAAERVAAALDSSTLRRRWLANTSLPLVAAMAVVLVLAAWPSQETPRSLDLTPLVASQQAAPASGSSPDRRDTPRVDPYRAPDPRRDREGCEQLQP